MRYILHPKPAGANRICLIIITVCVNACVCVGVLVDAERPRIQNKAGNDNKRHRHKLGTWHFDVASMRKKNITRQY